MYNRFLHQKLTKVQPLTQRNLERREKYVNNYKERIRSFLVSVATNPIELGQYIPPIKNIFRVTQEQKLLAQATLFINGFKTQKQRIERAESDNKLLDPLPLNPLQHKFRDRFRNKEIQSDMKFTNSKSPAITQKSNIDKSTKMTSMSKSKSCMLLPPISQKFNNPQKKTLKTQNTERKLHFKGLEELSNKLKSMEQTENQRKWLVNKLQNYYGNNQLQTTVFDVLQKCKLVKKTKKNNKK